MWAPVLQCLNICNCPLCYVPVAGRARFRVSIPILGRDGMDAISSARQFSSWDTGNVHSFRLKVAIDAIGPPFGVNHFPTGLLFTDLKLWIMIILWGSLVSPIIRLWLGQSTEAQGSTSAKHLNTSNIFQINIFCFYSTSTTAETVD